MSEESIVLIDGECVVCNSFAQFIMERDGGRFTFGTQASDEGKSLLDKHDVEDIDSIVLLKNNRCYTESDAVARIFSELSGFWSMMGYAGILPRVLRDPFYRLFSKYRYRIFGKTSQCVIGADGDRFLD